MDTENEKKFERMVARIKELKKSGDFDLSLEEDLSIAVMNLISLEEHFFFTAEKTGKEEYLDMLEEAREIRKDLLARMIDRHEGETWCISKHLLAASMRILEVATKLQSGGKKEEAKEMFAKAYKIYSIFWAVRLKLDVPMPNVPVPKLNDVETRPKENGPLQPEGTAISASGHAATSDNIGSGAAGWSVEDIVNKLVDCCDE